jgi:hypothetical protein
MNFESSYCIGFGSLGRYRKVKSKIILRIPVIFVMFTLLIPVPSALAGPPLPSPDIDGDGLPNELETDGWYNLAGGPFVTDPFDFDSDDDGLADGEEKLFNTHPLDTTSPGIYVRYQNEFMTREYFSPYDEMEEDEFGNPIRRYLPVLQGGDKYLMTEAMVVRRGTTFEVGGPASATLTIQGSGLTTLTPIKNACRNTWTVSVPAWGTVGTYAMTMTFPSSPSKSVPLYVIFEFPSDLSQAEIAAYIYDDEPANKRDEVSVWWRFPDWSYYWHPGTGAESATPFNPPVDCSQYPNVPCSNWRYHYSKGYAQAFWTEQFTQKVFVNHAMVAIHGQTNQTVAANAIANRADREYRVVYTRTHNNWADALHKWVQSGQYTMNGGACQDNANVFTTLLRSSGIAAKPFLEDYNKTAGHGEGGQIGSSYEYDHSVLIWLDHHWKASRSYAQNELSDEYYPFDHGIIQNRELYGYYSDYAADLMVSSDHRWDWQDGSSGGGMVNTVWSDQIEGIPTDEFAFPNSNWDIEWNSLKPLQIKRSPYAVILNYETWHGDDWAPSEWSSPPVSDPPGRVATQTYVLPAGMPNPANPMENWPYNPVVTACSPSSVGTPDCQAVLGAGGLSVQDQQGVDVSKLTYETDPNYVPEKKDATFNDQFSHQGVDIDGDGDYDKLVVYAGIDIVVPGTFKAQADLYDAEGHWVGNAKWEGSENAAAFEFDVSESMPPYTLEHLRLLKAEGALLSSRYYKAYEITDLGGMIDQGALSLEVSTPPAGGISGLEVAPTYAFTTTTVDTDGNGRYDELLIRVGVDVTDASGDYRVEGLLVDEYGTPVAWSVSDLQTLGLGNQELVLTFDGRILYDHMLFSGSQAFQLVAVKIFSGNLSPTTLEDEVAVAMTTPAFTRDDFEPASPASVVLEDDMENGVVTENNWAESGPWGLGTSVWHSRSHAWRANVSGSSSGSLTTISLDLTDHLAPSLRFSTCYDIGSSSAGYLEVSADGGPWTPLATYEDSSSSWITELIDLTSFEDTSNVQVRFNANSQNGLLWIVDDVHLIGWTDSDNDGLTNDDSDGDGVPDYLEPNNRDTDGDTIFDNLDPDDDGDGIPTADEDRDNDGDPTNDDYDNDGTPDYLDPDDDGDGILNVDEDRNNDGDPTNDDYDSDGTPDYLDPDDDGDGVPTADEDRNYDGDPTNDDTDNDGIPDYLDRDDDGDGVPTAEEDVNGDGDPTNDNSDGDGLPNYLDTDDDGDGVLTADEDPNDDGDPTNDDYDNDGTPDYLDPDDDGDGIPTATEGITTDTDSDHVPDYLEPNNVDTDGDGIFNYQDNDDDGDGVLTADEDWDHDGSPTDDDGNADGIPDYLDPNVTEAPTRYIYLPFVVKRK